MRDPPLITFTRPGSKRTLLGSNPERRGHNTISRSWNCILEDYLQCQTYFVEREPPEPTTKLIARSKQGSYCLRDANLPGKVVEVGKTPALAGSIEISPTATAILRDSLVSWRKVEDRFCTEKIRSLWKPERLRTSPRTLSVRTALAFQPTSQTYPHLRARAKPETSKARAPVRHAHFQIGNRHGKRHKSTAPSAGFCTAFTSLVRTFTS